MEGKALSRAFRLASHLQSNDLQLVCPKNSCFLFFNCNKTQKKKKQASPSSNEISKPLRVLITGAAGQIAYSLVFMIASGGVFGPRQELILHLLDIPPMKQVLEGVELEVEDGAFPLLKTVVATTDVKEAFTGVDVAILVGSFPRK